MPIRIRFLSGSRHGQVLEFDRNRLQIGTQSTDDLKFDPTADPGIEDRRAVMECVDGRWRIHSTGTRSIFVNQDPVTDAIDLNAGDLIRLSYDGPDFSFDQIPDQVAVPVAKVGVPARDASHYRGVSHFTLPMLAGALAICCGIVLVALFSIFGSDTMTVSPPEFQPFGVLKCDEGENLFWRPTLTNNHPSDRFSLADGAPSEMTIDPQTGTVRWQTTEQDGPCEIRCQIIVDRTADKQHLSDTETFEVQVREVNSPPIASLIPTQVVDLRQTDLFELELNSSDADVPDQMLNYQLKPQAPDGVSLDPYSGHITWKIDSKLEVGEYSIPYRVTDDATNSLSADGVVRVRIVSPDPWSIVEQNLVASIYLLVAKTSPGNGVLPIGTGCAIGKHSLLTSASVATAAQQSLKRGWSVMAIDTRSFDLNKPAGLEISKVESHVVFVQAASIKDPQRRGLQQAYFDLAVLTTDDETKATCRLGDVETTVKNNQSVGCFGYEIHGEALTRFDQPKPVFEKAKILEVISPPASAAPDQRPPLLLQLVGELPFQVFGGVIANQQAEVLGIYAFQGDLPADLASPPIHYAPEVLQAKAYLAGLGREQWVEPDISRSEEETQQAKPPR